MFMNKKSFDAQECGFDPISQQNIEDSYLKTDILNNPAFDEILKSDAVLFKLLNPIDA